MFLSPISKKEIIDLFFDDTSKNILKYYLTKNLSSIPEVRKKDVLPPIRIPKEYLEIFVSQMLNGEPAGSGNYPVDVIVGSTKLAIDISGLSISKNKNGNFKKSTGEKSLAQKFDSDNYGQDGEDLDDLFKHQESNKIVSSFQEILLRKYAKVFKENQVKSIYIFNFIFNNEDQEIYVSVLKLDQNKIQNFSAGNISASTCVINNAIDVSYGDLKAYKSKKRLELRLNVNGLMKADCIYKIKYSFGTKTRKINFREQLEIDNEILNKLKEKNPIEIIYE